MGKLRAIGAIHLPKGQQDIQLLLKLFSIILIHEGYHIAPLLHILF